MTLDDFRRITEDGLWAAEAVALLGRPPLTASTAEIFATYWVEGGHHIRGQIGDDHLLVRLLRYALPPYVGSSLELYRGENRARWELRRTGLAWTRSPRTAAMFGQGLNAVDGGGLLLRGTFDAEAIISGPNPHSRYLGEDQFTVDPFASSAITVVETFPPSD